MKKVITGKYIPSFMHLLSISLFIIPVPGQGENMCPTCVRIKEIFSFRSTIRFVFDPGKTEKMYI